MAPTPRIATCGGLSSGVNDSIPRLPRLLMVKVAPGDAIGGDGALDCLRGELLHLARQFGDGETVCVADHRDQQAARRVAGEPDVDFGMFVNDAVDELGVEVGNLE